MTTPGETAMIIEALRRYADVVTAESKSRKNAGSFRARYREDLRQHAHELRALANRLAAERDWRARLTAPVPPEPITYHNRDND